MSELINFAEIKLGGTPSTQRAEFWDGIIPWVSIVDFSSSKKIYKSFNKTKI